MKRKKVDILMLGGGGASLGIALTMILDIGYCTRFDYCWEWGEYHLELGIFVAIVAAIMFARAFRKDQRDYKEVYICPGCETALPFAEVPDEVCPKCGTPMEPLKGFYDRHPELKDKE